MKKIIIIAFALAVSIASFSQEEPTLFAKVCRYELSNRDLPVDTIARITVTPKQVRKGKFTFRYKNASGDSDVIRSFVIEDKTGRQVYTASGSSFKIKAKKLRALLAGSPLKISTMAIPSDPEKAKIVRVRPINVAVITLAE